MVRFDPHAAFDDDNRSAEVGADVASAEKNVGGDEGIAASRPLSRKTVEPVREPPNPPMGRAFPSWARPRALQREESTAAVDGAFSAGAGLALVDQILRAHPPFAGVLRQRLALRAATACTLMARLREDERALRDAEHLSLTGGSGTDVLRASNGPVAEPQTSPAGRIHRLWRSFGRRPVQIDDASLRKAGDLLELPHDIDFETLARALQNLAKSADNPLTAAAQSASMTLQLLARAACIEAEILALWLCDLMLAMRLGWSAAVPLIATPLAYPSSRSESGRRPRPDDSDWLQSSARAYALAAQDAYVTARDLERRCENLLNVAPKLRAKGAGRVVALLLSDDVVSPSRAARAAGISDRASRRLFDRLSELGAVRELSGRPSFRLYGL